MPTQRQPLYSTHLMMFDRKRKRLIVEASTLGLPPGRFPECFLLKSHHTERVVPFVQDRSAPGYEDGWDGQEMHYVPTEPRVNAQSLVIIND